MLTRGFSAATAIFLCVFLGKSLSAADFSSPVSPFLTLPALDIPCSKRLVSKFYLPSEPEIPKAFRRQFVYPSHRESFKSFRQKYRYSVQDEPKAAFEFYLQVRLRESSDRVVEQVRALLSSLRLDIRPDMGRTSGAYREAQDDRPAHIFIQGDVERYETGFYYAVLAHEIEHAIQSMEPEYDTGSLTPPLHKEDYWGQYLGEVGAIRAEYEYLRLLSPQAIEVCRQAHGRSFRPWPASDTELAHINALPQGFAGFRRSHLYRDYNAVRFVYANSGW